MVNLIVLTDEELAFITYAVEQEHDSIKHDKELKQSFIETASEVRKQLNAEYEARGLQYTQFEKHVNDRVE